MPKNYTAEDHKIGFNIWCDSRNLTEVSRYFQCDWGTPKRWMQSDYPCAFNCPWHGWVALIDEKDRAHTAKLILLNKGIVDPASHAQALREAIANPQAPRVDAVDSLVRSDLERVGQLEFIWSKCVYDMTGQVTDWRHFRGSGPGGAMTDDDLETQLKEVLCGGLHVTSLKDGVSMLKTLRAEIEAIIGNARVSASKTTTVEEDQSSREDLRLLKRAIKTMSPEELKALTVGDAERSAAC